MWKGYRTEPPFQPFRSIEETIPNTPILISDFSDRLGNVWLRQPQIRRTLTYWRQVKEGFFCLMNSGACSKKATVNPLE